MSSGATILFLAVFILLLALGVPIVFCVGLATLVLTAITFGSHGAIITVAQQVVTGQNSTVLLAIPFFILAGQIMNRSGTARRIVEFAQCLVGWLPGGLAFVNIASAMIFGAISGSAAAAASAIGAIMGPHMKDEGYDEGFAAAANITSATTGLIIPPSNILIVYSLVSGVSVAALFVGGYLPGLLVGLSLMVVSALVAWWRGYPTQPAVGVVETVRRFLVALPCLALIVIIIGGIIAGVFSATEASAVAVLWAALIAPFYGEIRWRHIPGVLIESATTTAVVMMLVGTSIAMSWILTARDIPQSISAGILGLSDNGIVILLLINLVLLAVGVFMDITPAVLIFAPIFLPIAAKLGIDPLHFGIIMVLNLCIGLCTPPVGSVLFIGCTVAKLPISRVVRPLIPFYIAMLVSLMIVTWVPALSTWLPSLLPD